MAVWLKTRSRLLESLRARKGVSASARPPDIVYGVDDVPPAYIVLLSGLQHVGLVTIFLIYPLLIVREIGASTALSVSMLSLGLIALGIATLLQGLPRGPIGSGFLCPANHTAVYLVPSLAAVKLGGLPLLFGMTAFAGLVECLLSPLLRRIRPLIPPELSGLVIFFVGMTVAAIGFRYLAGTGEAAPPAWADLVVGAITLGVTAGLNVWAKGNARLFCALIGMAVGYLAAIATGILPLERIRLLSELPLLAFPSIPHRGWDFSIEMAFPFVIVALAATLKTVGVITVCQRINDEKWVRPDTPSLSRGVLADGLGTMIAGAIGSPGLNTSTPCTGLAAATGLTSRVVGYVAGIVLIGLGFLPMLAGIFVIMPRPVMGAALIFAACFILINGLQTITSRMLDARRTLVVGLSLSAGLAAEAMATTLVGLPIALQPIFGSSLVLGTVCAILLNLLMRIGVRQRIAMKLEAGSINREAVEQFLTEQGSLWAARRDVIRRAVFGTVQVLEVIRAPPGGVEIEASFDEFNLDIRIRYAGAPLIIPDRKPSPREIMVSEEGERLLAGYLLRQSADRIHGRRTAEGAEMALHYDH